MISTPLILWCILLSGIYLLVVSFVGEFIARLLKLNQEMPRQLMEETGLGFYSMNFVMETLFFVVIPTVGYSFFYLILPLSGVRIGMAAALLAFTLGAMPITVGLSVRLKLSMPWLLFQLFMLLVKLGGSLTIIGYLYSL